MLKVDSIIVAYAAAPVLRGVSLEVRPGEIVALIGANGAGKTTLMKAISRLLPCAQGSITFEGQDITRDSPSRVVRLGLSQVPEGRRVFREMSIEENLEMGAYTRHREASLKEELDRVFALFPALLERRHRAAETLSGGEQQMLAIGRALMARPRLLLLDEPSMGLAPKMVTRIAEVVRKIRDDGATVLLVEQNAAIALKVSDRAYVLESGQIVMSGPSATIGADPRIAEAYLGRRASE